MTHDFTNLFHNVLDSICRIEKQLHVAASLIRLEAAEYAKPRRKEEGILMSGIMSHGCNVI